LLTGCNKISQMKKFIALFLLLSSFQSYSQFRLGVFGGVANYWGDMVERPFQSARGAFGLTGTWTVSQRFNIRTGLTFARVAGADSNSKSDVLRARNLSFQSNIAEFSLLGEYNFFNLDQIRWTPYVFGGLAVFHFDPFTYDQNNTRVYLKPLSTEGQGIQGYTTKPYKLTQMAIPFGAGFKYAITDRLHLGIEGGIRKLFTDYLDDVSSDYADPADLLAARGPQSADLAYRGDELPGGAPDSPGKGLTRGGAKYKDYYYFTGLHLTMQLGEGGLFTRNRDKGYGCPKVEY
jgi:hypothetical protein